MLQGEIRRWKTSSDGPEAPPTPAASASTVWQDTPIAPRASAGSASNGGSVSTPGSGAVPGSWGDVPAPVGAPVSRSRSGTSGKLGTEAWGTPDASQGQSWGDPGWGQQGGQSAAAPVGKFGSGDSSERAPSDDVFIHGASNPTTPVATEAPPTSTPNPNNGYRPITPNPNAIGNHAPNGSTNAINNPGGPSGQPKFQVIFALTSLCFSTLFLFCPVLVLEFCVPSMINSRHRR